MINVMIADDQELICQSLEIVIKSKSDTVSGLILLLRVVMICQTAANRRSQGTLVHGIDK